MALILNGTSSKLEWSGNLFGQTLPYSFLIWVKPAAGALTSNGWPIGWGVSGGGELGIQFAGNDAGDPVMAHARSSSDVTDWTCSVSPMVAGEWKPVLAVYTSTTSRTIYYDGKSFTSTTDVGITWTDFNRLTIGIRARTGDGFFNGEVANACVWNTALTPEDYAAILSAQDPSTIKSANVVDYWSLSTQAATQTGKNGRVLTATNTAQASTHPAPGAAPQGTVTISGVTPSSASAVVTYSYSESDQTGFEYRLNGGAAAALGASPATISGLTASTSYNLEVRAVNANGPGSWSTVSAFTTPAATDTTPPTLTGSVTFASITQTSYTASWPAGSDNVAVTGYEYQIGGTAGAWTNAGNSLSAAITGRTAGTTETVYVRAYDAAGNRSTPAISGSVTLASVATATITVGSALYPIKYSSASVLNETGLLATVLRADTLASVLTVSGVACNAGVITISNAALTAGTTYHLAVKTASGWTGLSDEVIAA